MVMVLHKFALLGGKVPAATGMRAAGRPPKAGRRTSFAAAAAPPGLRPAGCPLETLPHRAQQFSACFYRKVFAFCGLCFFADFAPFAAGTERIARPQKEKQSDRFYPPSPSVDFGLLQWGRIVPISARKSDWIVFIHPCRLSILGLCGGEERFPSPQGQGKRMGFFIPYRPVLPTAG